jgi:broad specificity phosphatase PhoE
MADEVWLLRHAETEWSRNGRHTGRTDIPLTDEGRKVAKALRARLEGHAFALVLCSPLVRARDTASLAGLECSGLRDDLLEWDYGEYEGLTTPQIREQRPDWYLWTDGTPGGESPDEVAAGWVDQPVALGGRLHLGTGSISVLGYEREVSSISRWNG